MNQVFSKTLYKNAGDNVWSWDIVAVSNEDGTAHLQITNTRVVGGEPTETKVPVVGMNIGKANETTPEQQAIAEAQSRVRKQLDKGYVETIEEARAPKTNSLGLAMPMLAHPIAKYRDKIDWNNAYAQPKVDGHRGMHKTSQLYSRGSKPILLPHIMNALEEFGLHNLHTDGEIYQHGRTLQEIGSLVKKPREESEQLQYWLYDLVLDAPYAERHHALAEALGAKAFSIEVQEFGSLVLLPTIRVDNEEGRLALHKKWVSAQFEGSMLRHGLVGYEDGKRSSWLLKGKDFDDGEWKVTGYREGTPHIDKQGNTYRIPVWTLTMEDGQTFEATAHGTVQVKHEQFLNADKHLGKMLTIRHFGFTPNGIPDLPVAVRWREDI